MEDDEPGQPASSKGDLKADNQRLSVQFKAQHGLLVLFFILLLIFHGIGIGLFLNGFLLSRLVLQNRSECAVPPIELPGYTAGSVGRGCWHPKGFDKAVVIVVDALRYDFTVPFQPKPSDEQPHYFHNALPVLYETSVQQPNNAFLRPFIADPPTTTLQRLKGLTTGTLPTFIDAGSNFAGTAIDEDNLVEHLFHAGKKVVHLGDDTWHSLFPGYFEPNLTKPYDSFNVWDLHTVDNGVNEHLFPLLEPSMQQRWDVVFGHYLGVDHAGHRYGPDHPAMAEKLKQMDDVFRRMIEKLDENTLLVVMGDHGMDIKGDHGGESDDEIEAALWMYSKKGIFGRAEDAPATPPATAKERPVGQIDLVPTLSLLLGMPVPFNNLGQPIEEAFLRSSKNPDYANMAAVSRITAAQIHRYQGEYAKARGLEPTTSTTASLWQKANDLYANAKGKALTDAYKAFAAYQAENLRLCRSLWARFDLVSMSMGIAVLASAFAIFALFGQGLIGDRSTLAPLLLTWGAAGTVVGACVGAAVGFLPDVPMAQTAAFGAGITGVAATLVGLWPARQILKIPLPRSLWGGLCTLVTLLLCVGFAANSFTIWEDEQLLFLLTTFGVLFLGSSLGRDDPDDRWVGVTNAASFLVATRLSSLSRLCREEQMPNCRSTYYASATSSTSASWQLVIPFVVALSLPSIVKHFFHRTRNYNGSAILWIGVAMRIGLVLVATFWVLDAADNNDWYPNLPKTTLQTSRVVLAQVVLALTFAAGYATYLWASPLLAVKEEAAEAPKPVSRPAEPDDPNSPIFTPFNAEQPKKKLIIFGYSNAHGTRYLLLPCAWVLALLLVQKPMGQGPLALCLLSIFNLLEVVDANGLQRSPVGPVVLALMGNYYFFKTGHQAALATIQWETAFIPLKTVQYPLSPMMVVLNTFGAQILCAIAVPAIALWKVPPKQPALLGRIAGLMTTHILFYAAIALATVVESAWLRRHLMLYRVFMPRMLMAVITLMLVEVVGALIALVVSLGTSFRDLRSSATLQPHTNSLCRMANQLPDPRDFNTWEDAFQYQLPVVRKLEQQLRRNINENRSKLRSLVGASYRDLLGTAERIIEMDGQMQDVEDHLGDIGRKCNARAVETANENQERMGKSKGSGERQRQAILARTKVLQNALSAAARAIRRGSDALLVSKLLVLSRLLHQSISESAEPPAVLEELKRKLSNLRRRLLSYIERALVRPGQDRTNVAHSLCAYSLVSNSTPKDVLRHFLQARFEQLDAKAESPSEADILDILELYRRTLLDTRALFPRLFAESMSELSSTPLLKDDSLTSCGELSLDVYAVWIPENVRTFTPWVRHDQLLSSDVGDALRSWTNQAQTVIHRAVESCLSRETDAQSLLHIRKKVLLQYLSLSANLRDGSHAESIKDLRGSFVKRLQDVARNSVESIALFENLDATSSSSADTSSLDLWQLSSKDLDLSHGAQSFRKSILDMRHGRDEGLQTCVQKLNKWTNEMDTFWRLLQQMRSTRWQDELDVDFDDLENGDEIRQALTKTDAEQTQSAFQSAVSEVLRHQYELIKARSSSSTPPQSLLRLLRELDSRRAMVEHSYGAKVEIDFYHSTIRSLHQALVEQVIEPPLKQLRISTKKQAKAAVSIWDGSPPLPVQPSPFVFRFMTVLQEAMSSAGSDLWSCGAVNVLKDVLTERLGIVFGDLPGRGASASKPEVNGHTEDVSEEVNHKTGETKSRKQLLQSLFNALFLCRVMGTRQTGKDDSLNAYANRARELAELDDATYERLQKNAGEYWKRTYLLFGLLALAAI
ncbi:hypothetical protein KC340_g2731 [Hortaea werneckii]|nr:hypothetical protein KC342_g8480 [Hortaea werneckii]KAI7104095.1 hypothetical protein KC339_g4784 [Hortaea werneckii]KAI7236275.1 hypothetical protein KC365_g5221 [Hortaea werneckii]KAI7333723.1 hypothetical protein KC340_g2731 [Hortaea werneckii]KAI7392652.1 hypothetical protein KC328_g6934 [Hortaea werneckii]